MDIIRENEDKIIKIRIWNEREKEDGFLDISEDLSGDIMGDDWQWVLFMDKDPSVAEILDELEWWEDEIALWNKGTNHEDEELDTEGTYYMTVEVDEL